MPELPEVHTIVSDLRNNVLGYSIVKTWVSPSYPKIHDKLGFAQNMAGQKITGVRRLAKNILIELDSGQLLHIHLAMTGQIFLIDPKDKSGKKAHVVFQIKRDTDNKIMTFSDTRMFGKIGLISQDELLKLEEKYGVEPIMENLDTVKLYDSLKKKKTIVKTILMDQSLISGLGNIYATEALFLAKVHPQSKMNALPLEKFIELIQAAHEVLNMGIANRGSTLPDKTYVDIWGNPGSQQDHFKVYLQNKCSTCESEIQNIKIGGRGTYFCPTCQIQY